MSCTECDLYEKAQKQVMPRGSDNPLIYFIGEAPGFEEDKQGVPFVGRSGQRLEKELSALGISDKIRIFNPVRCIPLDENNKIRKPTEEEIKCCEHHLIADINKTKPKVIVSLGSVPAKYLLGDNTLSITSLRGTLLSVVIGGVEYKYIPTYHPAFLLRKAGSQDLALQFSGDIERAYKIALSDDVPKGVISDNIIEKALDFISFKSFYYHHLASEERLAFDVETNSLKPFMEDSKIIGFSLAKKGAGIYVCFESLDYEMPEDERKRCEKFLLHILKEKKLVVHNSIFERSFVLSQYGYELPFDTTDDTLMMSRLMMGGHVSSKLKFQCVNNLKYPVWDKDINTFRNATESLAKGLSMARNSKYKSVLESGDICELLDVITNDIENVEEKLNKKKLMEIKNPIDAIINVVSDSYTEPELLEKIFKFISVVVRDNKYDSLPFSFVPERILSKYGAFDSIATFALYEYYLEKMANNSSETVDLFKGYRIYLEHSYLGYVFEKNGAFWDDEVVSLDEQKLNAICIDSLRKLILSPLLREYLIDTYLFDHCSDLLISDYTSFLRDQGLNIIQENFKGNLVLKIYNVSENKKYHIKHLKDKFSIPKEIEGELREKVYDSIVLKVKNCDTVEALKDFCNPNASTKEAKSILDLCLITDKIKMAYFVFYIYTEILGRGKIKDIDMVSTQSDRKILKLSSKIGSILSEDKPDYKTLKLLFEKVVKEKVENRLVDRNLQSAFGKALKYQTGSVGDSTIIQIFNLYRILGVDPDDKATWNNNFEWMVNFRVFKKAFKLASTYINGKVGRKSVKVVDKEELQSGKSVVIRKRDYTPFIASSEAFLLDTSFGVNTAETGRWRSFMHVLPSPPKKYFSSRFNGGTILQPDYSQMEVRVLAYEAEENKMLEAFQRGEDIHTFVAQQIYKREKVTSSERQFAKGATFSIIYGSSHYSFAEQYCGGDVVIARKIFKMFFSTFPKVKTYIDKKHAEFASTGKVSLPTTNRYVSIKPVYKKEEDKEKAFEKAKRQSQNFPIQGTASDIVGSVFFDICQYMIDKDYKSKPYIFTHDSDEIDAYPFELIDLIYTMSNMLNNIPIEKYNVPCHADITLGKSFGHKLVAKNIEYNDTLTSCLMKLEGYYDEFYDTVDNWKSIYQYVGVFDESWENEYVSINENFRPNTVFNIHAGQERIKGYATVKIKY